MARAKYGKDQLALPLIVATEPKAAVIEETAGEEAAPPPRPKSKRLVAAIQGALGEHTLVKLTDNRSTLVSHSIRRGELRVRVHQMFLDANDDVMEALGLWIAQRDEKAGALVDAFIASQSGLLKHNPKPLPAGAHRGRHHDLRPLFQAINQRYFGGALSAELMWGKPGSFRGRRRRTITLGTWDRRAGRVTIHPALDQAFVPGYVVERVVHHELCHASVGDERSPGGRKLVHGPRFKEAEARFIAAERADAWIEENLPRILRYRAPKAGQRKRPR